MARPTRGEFPCPECPRVCRSPGELGGHRSQHRKGRAVEKPAEKERWVHRRELPS